MVGLVLTIISWTKSWSGGEREAASAGGLPYSLLKKLALTTDLMLPRYNLLVSGADLEAKEIVEKLHQPKRTRLKVSLRRTSH